jgi:succinate dehydrogenase/fumarate reductase flavoprotein subunit
MKEIPVIVFAAGIAVVLAAGGIGSAFAHDPNKPEKPSKAAEWAADCVYAAMNSGTYAGTADELGQFCADAIKVAVNADYGP